MSSSQIPRSYYSVNTGEWGDNEEGEPIVINEEDYEKCTARDGEQEQNKQTEEPSNNLKRKLNTEQPSPQETEGLSSEDKGETKKARGNEVELSDNGESSTTTTEQQTSLETQAKTTKKIKRKYVQGDDYPWKESPIYGAFKMVWIESPIPTHSIIGQKALLHRMGSCVCEKKKIRGQTEDPFFKYAPMEVRIEIDQKKFEEIKDSEFQISGSLIIENRTEKNEFYLQNPQAYKFDFNPHAEVSRDTPISLTDHRIDVLKVKGTDFTVDPNNENSYVLKVLFNIDFYRDSFKEDYTANKYRNLNIRVGVNFQQLGNDEKITLWSPEIWWFIQTGYRIKFFETYTRAKPLHITQKKDEPPPPPVLISREKRTPQPIKIMSTTSTPPQSTSNTTTPITFTSNTTTTTSPPTTNLTAPHSSFPPVSPNPIFPLLFINNNNTSLKLNDLLKLLTPKQDKPPSFIPVSSTFPTAPFSTTTTTTTTTEASVIINNTTNNSNNNNNNNEHTTTTTLTSETDSNNNNNNITTPSSSPPLVEKEKNDKPSKSKNAPKKSKTSKKQTKATKTSTPTPHTTISSQQTTQRTENLNTAWPNDVNQQHEVITLMGQFFESTKQEMEQLRIDLNASNAEKEKLQNRIEALENDNRNLYNIIQGMQGTLRKLDQLTLLALQK
eukprot:TRINITY_DN2031_c0_g3_i7.p1 TRINITY_DN2031_c0_g3~~TRINITY_DN2031_c0_g3_i7.p1  ORF type:complete len:667 (+),score=205.92 TRINITY_DN2031_c0_g3_i7:1131-3131(+)